ncbi:MAG: radical SAM protein [Bacteroidota bacterium]
MKETDIILTHGYFLHEDAQEQRIMMPYPPLGLLYISAHLEQQGLQNTVLDSTFATFDEWKAQITAAFPRMLCFYSTLMTRKRVLQMASFLRTNEQFRNTIIIVGGPDVRHYTKEYLSHGFDYLVTGEGEQTVFELAKALLDNHNQPASGIAGTAHLTDGRVVTNPDRPLISHLDSLPFPARHKIDLNRYLDAWKSKHGYSSVNVSTMRGCPFSCNWCSKSVYGNTVRRRSAASVISEIESLKQQYSFDRIWFVDDVFTIDKAWMQEFAALCAEKQLQLQYEIITRADRLDEEIMQWLKQSGCIRIWIGAESGSAAVLEFMNRRTTPESVTAMMKLAGKYGIGTGTFIMLGYPGETKRDIAQTIKYLKESAPDLFTLTIAYPIKGTKFFNDVADKMFPQPEWATHSDRDIDFKRTYSMKYYRYAVRKVHNAVMAQRSAPGISKLKFFVKSFIASIQMLFQ